MNARKIRRRRVAGGTEGDKWNDGREKWKRLGTSSTQKDWEREREREREREKKRARFSRSNEWRGRPKYDHVMDLLVTPSATDSRAGQRQQSMNGQFASQQLKDSRLRDGSFVSVFVFNLFFVFFVFCVFVFFVFFFFFFLLFDFFFMFVFFVFFFFFFFFFSLSSSLLRRLRLLRLFLLFLLYLRLFFVAFAFFFLIIFVLFLKNLVEWIKLVNESDNGIEIWTP